jgi:processive 1,2-diacylglycerol beta-glucosyltransferase
MKKLLITYSSYGSGHKSVAGYIEKYFKEHGADYEIKVVNITDYSNFLGKFSMKFFDFVIAHRAEHFFDACYELVDNKFITRRQDRLAKILFDNAKLRKDIVDFQPDININSHFYGGNIVNYYNKKGLTNSKIISVLTDYTPHYAWLVDRKDQDAFIVANEVMKKEMINYGVEAKKVYPFGIPFDIDRANDLDEKDNIIKKYRLQKNLQTFVLFGGGSSGLMAFYDYFKVLVKQHYAINIIFICGKNEKLKAKSMELHKKMRLKNVRILGFTTDVYNILKIADCVISKPGGATVTECMEMNTPMILLPGLGGQEKYNTRFVKLHGFGTKARNARGLIKTMNYVIDNPKVLEKWTNNLKKQDRNDSLEKIFKLVEKMAKK